MDRMRLIEEIAARPALWNVNSIEYRSRANKQCWKEIAACMGRKVTVAECKKRWKYLRDAYRAEIRRMEIRIKQDILKGTYDPKNDYESKWACFESMQFIRHIVTRKTINIPSNDAQDDDSDAAKSDQFADFHAVDHIKLEPTIEMNTPEFNDDTNDSRIRLSEEESLLQPNHTIKLSTNSSQPQNVTKDNHSDFNKQAIDQVHFLENLEKEEQNLIKSTRLDISRANDLAHVGDSDYNFLVSFLPQLKKMNDLQNLQFRAEMTECAFRIMSQSTGNNNSPTQISSQPSAS